MATRSMDLSRFIYPLIGSGRHVPAHTKLLARPARAVVGLTVTPVRYRVIDVVRRRKRATTRPPAAPACVTREGEGWRR